MSVWLNWCISFFIVLFCISIMCELNFPFGQRCLTLLHSLFLWLTVVPDGEDDPQPRLVRRRGQPKPLRGRPVETGSDPWPPALWCRDRQRVHFLLSQLPHQPLGKHHKGELLQRSQAQKPSVVHTTTHLFGHLCVYSKDKARWMALFLK